MGRDVLRARTVKLIGQSVSKLNIYASVCYSGVRVALKIKSEMNFLPLGTAELVKTETVECNSYGAGASHTISMKSVEAFRRWIDETAPLHCGFDMFDDM